MSKTALRRPRAVVFDDDIVVVALLKTYLLLRGYDVLTYREPRVCPLYEEDAQCNVSYPCADIMLVDFSMPRMNGIELLKAQSARKCKLTAKNKALMTGYSDLLSQSIIDDLSCAFFEKPLNFNQLAAWFDECEKRVDLSLPLGIKRKEKRIPADTAITYTAHPYPGILNGVAINMSASGLCLKISAPLMKEQTVNIASHQSYPSWSASVKWLKDTGDGHFVAGLHHMR